MSNKLILGTAQFGMKYGVNNKVGKIPKKEIVKILNFSKRNNISYFDTASTYGESENKLGNYLKKNNNNFKIITKYSSKKKSIIKQFYETRKLTSQTPDIVLAHSYKDYISKDFQETLNHLIKEFKLKKYGASLYSPNEYFKILKVRVPNIIQVPVNIFDKRFLEKKIISSIKKNRIEVHARSIYLQGLLFVEEKKIYRYFKNIKKIFKKTIKLAENENLSLAQLSLLWVYKKKDINKIVLGIDSLSQLNENINLLKKKINNKTILEIDKINLHKNTIIKPNLWKIKQF